MALKNKNTRAEKSAAAKKSPAAKKPPAAKKSPAEKPKTAKKESPRASVLKTKTVPAKISSAAKRTAKTTPKPVARERATTKSTAATKPAKTAKSTVATKPATPAKSTTTARAARTKMAPKAQKTDVPAAVATKKTRAPKSVPVAKKVVPAETAKPVKKSRRTTEPVEPKSSKKSVSTKPETVPAPALEPVVPATAKPRKTHKPRKNKNGAPADPLATITVRRDAETMQTKISVRGRVRICTPSDVKAIFLRRGTKDLNLFDPETPTTPPEKPTRGGNKILTELPKSAPRKIGAVSLNDLFGYNPFAKDSVSAEEKLIPKKWVKFYKKLVALKASIQQEINEHSQTAFKRDSREESGDVSASYSQHTADIDNEAFTRDCALSLLAGKQQELAEINIAIERMKNGTYGICEITGKPIPVERLRDVPYTRYSIEGKLEAEKQRRAAARRHRANAATDIAAVTDIENDVPIVFNNDDEDSDNGKKSSAEPDSEEEESK